jgi:hypothetical protein
MAFSFDLDLTPEHPDCAFDYLRAARTATLT